MSDLAVIFTCLQDMIIAHQNLLNLAEEKKNLLIKGQMDQMVGLLSREAPWINRIQSLEESRQQLMIKLQQQQGINSPSISMEEWINGLPSDVERKKFSQIRIQLKDVVWKLKEANELNQKLTQQSIAYVRFMLDSLVEEEEEMVYSKPSMLPGMRNGRSYFNSRV